MLGFESAAIRVVYEIAAESAQKGPRPTFFFDSLFWGIFFFVGVGEWSRHGVYMVGCNESHWQPVPGCHFLKISETRVSLGLLRSPTP
jgi:hypothetical protein